MEASDLPREITQTDEEDNYAFMTHRTWITPNTMWLLSLLRMLFFLSLLFFFLLFRAVPVPYRGYQARGQIRATAAGHSDA